MGRNLLYEIYYLICPKERGKGKWSVKRTVGQSQVSKGHLEKVFDACTVSFLACCSRKFSLEVFVMS